MTPERVVINDRGTPRRVVGPSDQPQRVVTADGLVGREGESAYATAVDNGFVGTEAEWLASLEGEQGDPGDRGPAGTDTTSFLRTAGVTLSGHRLVVPDVTGAVVYADNATLAHLHRPVWLTKGAAVASDPVDVLAFGVLDEPTWSLAAGQPIYLGANGALTQTPPSRPAALFLLQVGSALTPTSIFLDPDPPIGLT